MRAAHNAVTDALDEALLFRQRGGVQHGGFHPEKLHHSYSYHSKQQINEDKEATGKRDALSASLSLPPSPPRPSRLNQELSLAIQAHLPYPPAPQ